MSQLPSTGQNKALKPPPSAAAAQSRDRTFIPQNRPAANGQYYPSRPRRHERTSSGCCRCLLWSTLILLILIVLVGLGIGIFFAIFHPKHPTFTVSTIRMTQFELTPSDQLFSTLNLNFSTANPSASGLKYVYSNISISVYSASNIWIGDGQIPAYEHAGGNTVMLSAIVKNDGKVMDADTAASLRKKTNLEAMIDMEGEVGVKAGSLNIDKVTIRVSCEGVMIPIAEKKLPVTVTLADERCKVDVKVFKWYV